jgi:RNA-splicing ligase RtcB
MPDVHAGMGCTIGTTMTITDKIVPGMVGVDIGCGMETAKIEERGIDFEKLDALIRKRIPCGREVHTRGHSLSDEAGLDELRCASRVNLDRAGKSIGTLGGGNHFIEVDTDPNEDGALYIVVHSGSRHLGTEVATYYQDEAYRSFAGNSSNQVAAAIAELKSEGRNREIEGAIRKLRAEGAQKPDIPKDLAYATGELFADYIHDMRIVQQFAVLNRQAMMNTILTGMRLTQADRFSTIHNYIDTDRMILRKGAVSAMAGEKLLIPINMRDGSLICIGKGNDEWNCSAPHGAGRLMSRKAAFAALSMDEYKAEMEGIYTTSVTGKTLDESPMAYKSMEAIISQIGPTAEIETRIKPVYNFKATE